MTKLEKMFADIINNPKNVRFEDLDRILKFYGFECRQPRGGSSHYTYFHSDLVDILTVPKDKPIKAIYVKKAIIAIEKLERGEEQ